MNPGVVAWSGPSLLDGAPIVCVATRGSRNRKTGSMVQFWILRDDMAPIAAVRSGADRSVCGSCKLRGSKPRGRGRGCYVTIARAPTSVYHAYKRGTYRAVPRARLAHEFAGEILRIGAYGDPAAVPRWVWERATVRAASWTGYTHQWAEGFALAEFVMASVESPAERDSARAMGYRTFEITRPGAPRPPRKIGRAHV